MEKRMIKPDFHNSIVNISATLAEYLGCPNDKPTLPVLEEELAKGYKNIVLLVLDGMGVHPLRKNLPQGSFFMRHTRQILTSVFPSTTTNATTSYITNKYPMEHGWFGWSLYLEELGRAVDIFLDRDSFTHEQLPAGTVRRILPAEPFWNRAGRDYAVRAVAPAYWNYEVADTVVWSDIGGFFDGIRTACKGEGKHFVYAYCDEPDHTMHEFGVTSEEAKRVIGSLERGVEQLQKDVEDTLFIVSADHGQIDVGGTIELYRDTELTALLQWPQYLDARAVAFKVKDGCGKTFAKLFRERYGGDFELVSSDELIDNNYFGGRGEHAKRLGDFIAVGKTDKIMRLTPLSHDFKGHHASLTEEMEVPLILVGSKKIAK